MWAMDAQYAALISGDHTPGVVADALYDGDVTVAGLGVTECTVTRQWDGGACRTSVSLTVDDDGGALQPLAPTDPLSPAGQELVLAATVGLESHTYGLRYSVPLGILRIQKPQPTGRWSLYRGQAWIPTGGVVPLDGEDRIGNLQRSDILGVMQPLAGATVRSEVVRICQPRRIPVDTDSLPSTSVASVGVYPTSALDAVCSLLDTVGLVPAMTRTGMLTARSATRSATPDLVVTPESGRLIESWIYPDDDGIVNLVEATGEGGTDSAIVRGYARETTGPYRWDGPFGWVAFRQSSPLYTASSEATKGAATILAKKLAGRELVAGATITFDPSVDELDTHSLWLAPGLTVPALVTKVQCDPGVGGPMTVTYSVDRSVVEEWTRPLL